MIPTHICEELLQPVIACFFAGCHHFNDVECPLQQVVPVVGWQWGEPHLLKSLVHKFLHMEMSNEVHVTVLAVKYSVMGSFDENLQNFAIFCHSSQQPGAHFIELVINDNLSFPDYYHGNSQ